MAIVKPVQPSVVNDVKIWKQILQAVLKKPTASQIQSAKLRSERFKKVSANA
ncbi:hypothetical protein [Treponema saccharophilum]|uniref:hypothetical protein n=1 Tax=Treponema saccharophilum TaxID=165 RepID=UPI00131F46C2|nr:hypothetical protein [Treponema saccharophilum]